MKVTVLGSGSAWAVPEHGCGCVICRHLRDKGESRTRTSLFIETGDPKRRVLVDPGPDLAVHMRLHDIPRPDEIIITHAHADHFIGLDELWAYPRQVPRDRWRPIPVYATEESWPRIEARFDYLIGRVIERRVALCGRPLNNTPIRITPFATDHGPHAPGSAGYVFEADDQRVVYTSDFFDVIEPSPRFVTKADLLLLQANFFNEPENNSPHHMSLQRALTYLPRFDPKGQTLIVHIGVADMVEGDPHNSAMKKRVPKEPLTDLDTGRPLRVPLDRDEWQATVDLILKQRGLDYPVSVAHDGLVVDLEAGVIE